MFKINIFGKENCAKCSATKKKVNHFLKRWDIENNTDVNFFDMDSVDGLAEGAFLNVSGIPTTILEGNGQILGRWDKKVPRSDELKKLILADSKQ